MKLTPKLFTLSSFVLLVLIGLAQHAKAMELVRYQSPAQQALRLINDDAQDDTHKQRQLNAQLQLCNKEQLEQLQEVAAIKLAMLEQQYQQLHPLFFKKILYGLVTCGGAELLICSGLESLSIGTKTANAYLLFTGVTTTCNGGLLLYHHGGELVATAACHTELIKRMQHRAKQLAYIQEQLRLYDGTVGATFMPCPSHAPLIVEELD